MKHIHSNPPDMIGRLPIFRSFSRPNKKSPDETTSVKLLEKGETEANSLTAIDNKCQEGIFHGLEDLMFKIPPLDTTMVVSQGQIHCTSHSILMQTPDIRNLRVGMYVTRTSNNVIIQHDYETCLINTLYSIPAPNKCLSIMLNQQRNA